MLQWANRRGIRVGSSWVMRVCVYACCATCHCVQVTCQRLIYGLISMQQQEIEVEEAGGRGGERKDHVVRA